MLPGKAGQALLNLLRPVPGADDNADERRVGEHFRTTAQERPCFLSHRQAAAGQRGGRRKPGGRKSLRNDSIKVAPENLRERVRADSLARQRNNANADWFGVQSHEDPSPAVMPVVVEPGQRPGEINLHHTGGQERAAGASFGIPVAECRSGCWQRHATASLIDSRFPAH